MGSEQNLLSLYREHGETVFRLLCRMTGDEASARDLTHDTFVRAFERWDQYAGHGPAASWICSIAANLARDRNSRFRRRAKLLAREAPRLAGSTTDIPGGWNPGCSSTRRSGGFPRNNASRFFSTEARRRERPPYLTRGVLIDVAGYKGVERLPDGYVVTLADVRGTLAAQGMSEDDLRPGDALLFNFGWWRLWPEPKAMGFEWPGIGREVAEWVVERQASMVGSDAATDEVTQWAVHDLLTLQHGIFNLELMTFEELLADDVHEFLFVFTPLRLKGASGSPGRPLAIR